VREFVGIRLPSELVLSPSFKREALMFSRVGILNLDKVLDFASKQSGGRLGHLKGELEWLLEHDVIFDPARESGGREVSDEEYAELLKLENLARKEAGGKVPQADKELERRGLGFWSAIRQKDDLSFQLADAVTAGLSAEIYGARRECIRLRLLHRMDAYPVLILRDVLSLNEKSDKNEVVKIALESLPIPDESTPWEQIIEYRNDPDSKSKFLALRNWMSEVARSKLTPAEVEERLEYLMDLYQNHMRVHRMKTNAGVLETLVTTGTEFMGGLLSSRWGKAAQALFSLQKRKVALLEGELLSPGREVAYIVKARGQFKTGS
jgi:hypothetical protein